MLDMNLIREKPDVVLMDLAMPGMDGVNFLAKAMEISPNSVRMMLTGHGDFETALDEDENQTFLDKYLALQPRPEPKLGGAPKETQHHKP